jgi:hypothetical protein
LIKNNENNGKLWRIKDQLLALQICEVYINKLRHMAATCKTFKKSVNRSCKKISFQKKINKLITLC